MHALLEYRLAVAGAEPRYARRASEAPSGRIAGLAAEIDGGDRRRKLERDG